MTHLPLLAEVVATLLWDYVLVCETVGIDPGVAADLIAALPARRR